MSGKASLVLVVLALLCLLHTVDAQSAELDFDDKAEEKRVPHPKFRTNYRVHHFQQGELPPGFGHNYAPFMGRFGRALRNRPFYVDY